MIIIRIPLLAFILQGIPEQIAVVTMAFVIAKATLDWKIICFGGLFLAITSYLLRLLPITFGVHTVVLIGTLICIITMFGKKNINTAIMASLISFLALIVFETLCISSTMLILKITKEQLISNIFLRILVPLPQVVLLFITAYFLKIIRK